jgi:hypothetical protein
MATVPRREFKRPLPRVSRAEAFQDRVVEDMKYRASLPKNHPDYASPDSEVDDNNISRDASGKEIDISGKKPKNKGK